MANLIYTFISFIYLTTGRRLYALRQCQEVAKRVGAELLTTLIDEAIAHDTRTASMEDIWSRSRKTSTTRGASQSFAVELEQSQPQEVSAEALEAARYRGNLFIRQIAAVILGTFYRETEDDAAIRQSLLKPFLEQINRVQKSRKSRRQPQDIDPNTGMDVIAAENAA